MSPCLLRGSFWEADYPAVLPEQEYIGIVAYTAGATNTLLKLPYWAGALTFDSSGNLWAANIAVVFEVAARGRNILRTLSEGTRGAQALAFDRKGNLYVARSGASSSEPSSVSVFPPHANEPSREITEGINLPDTVRVDASGDLVVANCPSCWASNSGPKGSVTLYHPNRDKPFRTITEGIDSPITLASGHNGLLFVANFPYTKRGRGSSVSVYTLDGKLVRKITDGIFLPVSLAVDEEGHLYVANCRGCVSGKTDSITVYSADGSQLLQTITNGVRSITTIAIGGTSSREGPF